MTDTQVATQYFAENSQAKDDVLKAYYAYHVVHFREIPTAHNFTNGARYNSCVWCGRTREQVRHDDLPPQCQWRPQLPDISEVIHDEEVKFATLSTRSVATIDRVIATLGLSGATLAVLHHTYGIDPETVALRVDVSSVMLSEYNAAMEVERARSRARQVKEVITIK